MLFNANQFKKISAFVAINLHIVVSAKIIRSQNVRRMMSISSTIHFMITENIYLNGFIFSRLTNFDFSFYSFGTISAIYPESHLLLVDYFEVTANSFCTQNDQKRNKWKHLYETKRNHNIFTCFVKTYQPKINFHCRAFKRGEWVYWHHGVFFVNIYKYLHILTMYKMVKRKTE